jgi:hypothetical protein
VKPPAADPADQPIVHNLPYRQGDRPIPLRDGTGRHINSPMMGETTVFVAANGVPAENLSNPFKGIEITAANEGYFHDAHEDAHLPASQRRVIDSGSAVQSDSMSIHVPRANLLSSNVLADLSMSGGRHIPVNAPVFEMLNRTEIGMERVGHENPDSNVVYASFAGRGGRGNVLTQPGMQYGEMPMPSGWS